MRRRRRSSRWLDPSVIGSVIGVLRRAGPRAHAAPSTLATLTPRERDVLVLMAEGRSNAEISAQLFVRAIAGVLRTRPDLLAHSHRV